MHDNARGGDDTLTGGESAFSPLAFGPNATNELYGDAGSMDGNTHGGDDTLTGGGGATNYLYGDAGSMDGNARGGDDTLTGGGAPTSSMATPAPWTATPAAAMTR